MPGAFSRCITIRKQRGELSEVRVEVGSQVQQPTSHALQVLEVQGAFLSGCKFLRDH